MTAETTIYLAGPVAHVSDGGAGWRSRVVAKFGHEFAFKDPLSKYNVPVEGLTIEPGSVDEEFHDTAVGVNDIVEGDKELLEASDAVLVGYKPVRSIGTPMEVMWAYERDMPVVLWDINGNGDLDALSPWYRYHVDAVSSSIADALGVIKTFAEGVGEP